MRKLIAGMKISVDGYVEGPEGYADWVEGWSRYGLTPYIDACVLGGMSGATRPIGPRYRMRRTNRCQ